MTPDEMRRAAELLQAAGTCDECTEGMSGQLVVDDEGKTGFISDEHFALARLLREQADAMGWRMLAETDSYCPSCGHNRDTSSVSTIEHANGLRECQMCGAEWNELPPPPEGAK